MDAIVKMLMPFCRGKWNPNIAQPWSREGFTYATDGFAVIRIPRIANVPERPTAPKAEKVFTYYPAPAGPWLEFPTPEETGISTVCPRCRGQEVHCKECNGSGMVEFSNRYNDYEIQCKSCSGEGDTCSKCGGSGEEDPQPETVFAGFRFKSVYLRAFRALPGAKINVPVDPKDAAWIKFDGGDGLVMPMSQVKAP